MRWFSLFALLSLALLAYCSTGVTAAARQFDSIMWMRVNHAEPDYVFHYTGVVDDTMTPEPDDASLGYNQRGKVKVHMEIADPLKSIPKLKAGDALTFAHSRFPGDAVVTAVPEVGRKLAVVFPSNAEADNWAVVARFINVRTDRGEELLCGPSEEYVSANADDASEQRRPRLPPELLSRARAAQEDQRGFIYMPHMTQHWPVWPPPPNWDGMSNQPRFAVDPSQPNPDEERAERFREARERGEEVGQDVPSTPPAQPQQQQRQPNVLSTDLPGSRRDEL